jgi:hypothetical protein
MRQTMIRLLLLDARILSAGAKLLKTGSDALLNAALRLD